MTQQELRLELEQQRTLLLSYQELYADMGDDAAYVARGNGFCDNKYSDNFLEQQIAAIEVRIDELERRLSDAVPTKKAAP